MRYVKVVYIKLDNNMSTEDIILEYVASGMSRFVKHNTCMQTVWRRHNRVIVVTNRLTEIDLINGNK